MKKATSKVAGLKIFALFDFPNPQIHVTETCKDFQSGKDAALNAALHAPLPQIIRVS
jgi:hypothetical protein